MVPYLKPVRLIVPVSPEKEPRRVAPPELISSVPPVTTLAVACGVGELHFSKTITTLDVVPVALPTLVLKKPFPTVVPDEGCASVP